MDDSADPAAPLAGVTVLDYGSVGPGARACRILADFGARITRIDPPAGIGTQLPFYAYGAMRGIRRCRIDVRVEEGRRLALRLAQHCDVILDGYRPGVADRLGIGYPAVSAVNPSVIYCAASGYGAVGRRSTWAGHDLNYLAVTGFLHTAERTAERSDGQTDGRPTLPGATVADAAGGGMHAAMAIMAALVQRQVSGTGRKLDVAATDGMLGIMSVALEEYLATGRPAEPGSGILTGRYACYGVYGCADGKWLTVAAVEPKFFANLCALLGHSELAVLQYDDRRQHELRAQLTAIFATRTRDEWVDLLAAHDTCVAPVLSIEEVTADAHHRERGAFTRAHLDGHGDVDQVGPVWAGSARITQPLTLNGEAGGDTDDILGGLGYDDATIARLRADGIVG